ncbi:uncharacterized protein LOC134943827 [Pseudophryne corroboree]|uniref:uncharacterized protein LOC134943827 n=1 Tax=Pseudophryne corroboree TaxID=495146 RepID=UPI003081B487
MSMSSLASYDQSDYELLMDRVNVLMPSITPELFNAFMTGTDCEDYSLLVQTVSQHIGDYTPEESQSLCGAIKDNAETRMTAAGVCPVSGENSSATIMRLFGNFSVYASYADLLSFIPNLNGLSAIGVLSPEQVANMSLTGDTLSNPANAQIVIQTLSEYSFSQLDSFLSTLTTTAEQNNLASLPNANIQNDMFAVIFGQISLYLPTFTVAQFNAYFGINGKFDLFLTSFSASDILQLPNKTNCNSFQIMMSGLSRHFAEYSEVVQQAAFNYAYGYLSAQLSSTGSACLPSTGDSGVWLNTNLGAFGKLATNAQIKALYPSFQFDAAGQYLTPVQLATYMADNAVLSNTDKITMIFIYINSKDVLNFLDEFNEAASKKGITQINSPAAKLILGDVFCTLRPMLPSFTADNYTSLISVRLEFFFYMVNAQILGYLADVDCASFAAIVDSSGTIPNLQNINDVVNYMETYLQNQKANTGSACNSGRLDSREWLMTNCGKFASYISWSTITSLYPDMDLIAVLDKVTPEQAASACASSNIIFNVTAVSYVLNSYTGNYDASSTFMYSLIHLSSQILTPTVKTVMLNFAAENFFPLLNALPTSVSQNLVTNLTVLFTSINSTFLSYVPLDIPCTLFKTIVTAFTSVFQSLPDSRRMAVADFMTTCLQNKYTTEGDACTGSTDNTGFYAVSVLGPYSSYISAAKLMTFFPKANITQYSLIFPFAVSGAVITDIGTITNT